MTGLTDARKHLCANAVDRAGASAADRDRRAAAARSRSRTRHHQRLDCLVIERAHTQTGSHAALLVAHNRRTIDRCQYHVGRTLGLLHPKLVVAVVLGQQQVVELTVVVDVLAFELVIADVFVHIVGAHTGLRGQANGVAFFDGLGIVGAGVVSGGSFPALGVIADVIARQRQADRGTHASDPAAANAERGGHDGRVDPRRIARGQVDWRAHPQVTVKQLGPNFSENYVDRARAGARYANAHGAADRDCRRRRCGHHADARFRSSVQAHATADIGLNIL